MRTTALATLLLLAILAAPAVAKDADPETLFHEAYLAEVVDGKIAEAAKVYFALSADEDVPAALRAEAGFRFAVTCVLLGRADEARSRFATILADPETPEMLRARVLTYHKAIEGVGVGTELDKKLESLVFELGRAPLRNRENSRAYFSPEVYRDFQIIGKPCVPLLTQLLDHPDATLRQHAFRLLLQMDEPGMPKRYDPLVHNSGSAVWDLISYGEKRPGEWRTVEERLLAVPDADLAAAVRNFYRYWYRGIFSGDFLRDLGKREGAAIQAPEIVLKAPWTDQSLELLQSWLSSENELLTTQAAAVALQVAAKGPSRLSGEATFRAIVSALSSDALGWRGSAGNRRTAGLLFPDQNGLTALGKVVSGEVLLDVLAGLVEIGKSQEGEFERNPLANGLADTIAQALDGKSDEEIDFPAYAALLGDWLSTAQSDWFVRACERTKQNQLDGTQFPNHVQRALGSLPEEDAIRLARGILQSSDWLAARVLHSFSVLRPEDVRLLAAIWFDFSDPSRRSEIIHQFPLFSSPPKASEELLLAHADVLAGMVLSMGLNSRRRLVGGRFAWLCSKLPAEKAREVFLELVLETNEMPPVERDEFLRDLALIRSQSPEGPPYRREIVAPSLEAAWESANEGVRGSLVKNAISLIGQDTAGAIQLGDAKRIIGEFVRSHLDQVQWAQSFQTLAREPELFPPEEWIAIAPGVIWNDAHVRGLYEGKALGDDVARKLVSGGKLTEETVLGFVRRMASPEVQGELLGEVLTKGDPKAVKLVAWVLGQPDGAPIGPDALEVAIARGLEEADADLSTLAMLGRFLANSRPSEKLFPLVTRLLASEENDLVYEGMEIAKRLGREEMIEHLISKLDSMDAELRSAAKGAIDSILEVRRIRDEAKERFRDLKK